MNYWITADTHFGHDRMTAEDTCNRPVDFATRILNGLRKNVRPGDTLIHLGDFCFYNEEEWHRIFMGVATGRKWLIRGNHDGKSLGWYYDHGWDFVADEIILKIYGKRVAFSHRPLPPRDDYDLNIHGHLHNSAHHPEDVTNSKSRLVFLEHAYLPISLQKMVEK